MNTLVEKMFGIIMFLAMFVPFQLGLYTSYMATWEFTQVTDEFTQLVRENGGLTGTALEYKDQLEITYEEAEIDVSADADKDPSDLVPDQGYEIKVQERILEDIDGDGELEPGEYIYKDVTGKQPVGKDLYISIKSNETAVYNWKPDLHRENIQVTVYRR